MRHIFTSTLALALLASSVPARAQNPEDAPIVDQPVAPATGTGASAPAAAPAASPATITVPRAVWEQLLKDVEELKRNRGTSAPTVAPVAPAVPAPARPAPTSTETTGSRNYLLLPDISFIANGVALASSDKRDEDRNNLGVEAEIGIQGYAYPGVKYDAYIVGAPGEDEAFGLEEGYVTFQGALRGLDINVGRKFAAFGRTGELHPHSWLSSRQYLARQNMVAGEALGGNGVQLNYLIPTPKSFFARASVGVFGAAGGSEARVNTFDPTDPFEGGGVARPGAGYDRFYNARLWLGKSVGKDGELELGTSYADGRAGATNIVDDGTGAPTDVDATGRIRLSGVDVQYRRFLGDNKRLLLRSEYFTYKPENLPTSATRGFYAEANYRANKYADYGLLYERTGFPTVPGQKETTYSLIYTRRFSERYYMRLMGTRGDRPGEKNLNEVRLQFVTGLGPHTHNLE